MKRRNAVGNAFSVAVVSRLLTALVIVICSNFGSVPSLEHPGLAAPYHHDVRDDLLPSIQKTAADFSDFTAEFHESLPKDWSGKLIGPDPGAGGRKNRAQRAAGPGLQQGSHLSRNGLSLLSPEDKHKPWGHAAQAQELEHPFSQI